MRCFLVLLFMTAKSETVFEMVDGTLHSSSDFIGTYHSTVPHRVWNRFAGLFWIDIDHFHI